MVPWRDLEALIEPYCSKAGNGRQPVGLSIMLRVYILQQWLNLSDPGAEDALYESPVLPRFAGVDLSRAAAPDETTVLRFRRLLEQNELCGQILDTVNHYLASRCLRIATGSVVDQEQQEGARSADASDAQGPAAADGFSALRRIAMHRFGGLCCKHSVRQHQAMLLSRAGSYMLCVE